MAFILLLTAVGDPFLTKYTDKLLGAVAGEQFVGVLPLGTVNNAGQQWVSDLGQSVVIEVVQIAGAVLAGELVDESYYFTLSRGMSRKTYILVKFYALHIVLTFALALAVLVNFLTTYAVFNGANFRRLIAASALWLVYVSFIITAVAALVVTTSSTVSLGAFGIGGCGVMGWCSKV